MLVAVVICLLTCVSMFACVLLKPSLRMGRRQMDTYWMVALGGVLVLSLCSSVPWARLWEIMTTDNAVNPLKILILFISMTILSIYLDEFGFFRYLANIALLKARTSQRKLFVYLYVTVAVLTVFTSNDIIILSFTPFICFFARNARISPLPYLSAEFVAANTWSMALVIGNPTNIYLATARGVDFVSYLRVMWAPTLAAGLVAMVLLWLLYRRQLAAPIKGHAERIVITDRLRLVLGLIHLGVCTVCLVISSYIGLEMWFIAGLSALSLLVCASLVSAARRERPVGVIACLERAPWALIPFLLSMFVMTLVLTENGLTARIAALAGEGGTVLKYGLLSFVSANLLNNIPMTVLFQAVIDHLPSSAALPAVYATVIGSNLGALLTPIGALAGIMWRSILTGHGWQFRFADFLKMGTLIGLPTLLAALGCLLLTI